MLLYSGYDNILSICSTKHMQVNFVLQQELLQADILELDTLFSLLSTLALTKFFRQTQWNIATYESISRQFDEKDWQDSRF